MTYYADLTPYTYDRGSWDPEASSRWRGLQLLNIGWLSRSKNYSKGVLSPGAFS
ncbi:DUF7919 family protein [Streptomyces caniferus]